MTFVGDGVFKQGRIAGKAGKRTTGIAGKPYTFFHKRLEKLDKHCRSIITVVNIGFWNF